MNRLSARILGLTAGLAVVTACSSTTESAAPANRIIFNNFENLAGWIPATPTLTSEKAHSGRFAVKVDQDNEFGTGYRSDLGSISPTRIKTLTLKVWALRTGADAKAAVVVTIVDSGDADKQVFWQALDLSEEVKTYNRWTAASKTFVLPENVTAAHKLQVYLWRNGGSQPVYIDDLELLHE